MKQQFSSSEKYGINRCQFFKVIFYSFYHSHGLTPLILHQGIVFQRFGHQCHLGHLPNSSDIFILSVEHFPGGGHNFQFRIESREQVGYQVLKTVEYRQGAD
jgi:hypothetical protein